MKTLEGATNDLNYDSYLARAIEIFNDKMDADFPAIMSSLPAL